MATLNVTPETQSNTPTDVGTTVGGVPHLSAAQALDALRSETSECLNEICDAQALLRGAAEVLNVESPGSAADRLVYLARQLLEEIASKMDRAGLSSFQKMGAA